jgi:hypothetical protein
VNAFAAKYPGRCTSVDCSYGDNRINVGDSIEYVIDEIVHASCARHARLRDIPVCDKCFEYHKGECW